MQFSRAKLIADRIVEKLLPFCEKIEIAGSIRRLRPECGDIDIVALPHDRNGLESELQTRCTIEKNGEDLIAATLRDGTHLDLWFARPQLTTTDMFETRTIPGNFGSVLLCRTGSKAHNIGLVEHAKRLSLRWHPHDGVFHGQDPVAAETEEAIFAALSLPFIDPTDRENFSASGHRF
jgi:DNA polymerase (family 10)